MRKWYLVFQIFGAVSIDLEQSDGFSLCFMVFHVVVIDVAAKKWKWLRRSGYIL